MKLIGSRAAGTHDDLSDWDWALESEADLPILEAALGEALVWKYQQLGELRLVTLLAPDLALHDYSSADPRFAEFWSRLAARQREPELSDYWLLAAKHLKGLHRGYLLLLDAGIELSATLLRDRFVKQTFDLDDWASFRGHRMLGPDAHEKLQPLFAVTGLPARTKLDRLEKLLAMNALYTRLTPALSEPIQPKIAERLHQVLDAELVQAAARNHRSRFLQSGSWASQDAVAVGESIIASSSEVILAFPEEEINLDEALALARKNGVKQASCWSLLPTPDSDLGARLLARGFQWGWQPHWMALDLSEPLPEFPTPEGLQVRLNHGGDAWDVQNLPYYDAENQPRPRERTWHFGAWLDGRVVGQSVLHVSEEGIGGIYNVGVVPEQRQRGIGRAVSRAACEHAQSLGVRWVLLNAATHIYSALGFRSLGYGQTWWIFKETIAKTPLPPEQIAFVEALGRGDVEALGPPPIPLDETLLCGMTPLELCARLRQQHSADWLLERGATPDVLSLYDLGRADSLPELLSRRPELASHRRGAMGATPLHEAVERNDLALARLILAARPDLSIKDTQFHATPLDWAKHLGRMELVTLLESQADLPSRSS